MPSFPRGHLLIYLPPSPVFRNSLSHAAFPFNAPWNPQPATPEELATLGHTFGAFAHIHEKNGTLAFRVRREEPGHLVVIKSQASSAQVLGVGRKIHLAS